MTAPSIPTRVNRLRVLLPALLAILCACGGKPVRILHSQLSHFPGDVKDPELEVSGIYTDGWVGETGSVKLQQPAGGQTLSFRATLPKTHDLNFQTPPAPN